MRLDLYHHGITATHDDDRLDLVIKLLEKLMHTLDETLTLVTAEPTRLDSIIALINGLKQQLADALAGATLSPSVQAKVDAMFDAATASAGKIDTAIQTGNPPVPPAV